MLNYVWMGLIALGMVAAVSTDLYEKADNKYRNGEPFEATVRVDDYEKASGKAYDARMIVEPETFNEFYDADVEAPVETPIKLTATKGGDPSKVYFTVDAASPEIWRTMASVTGEENDLTANATLRATDEPGVYRAEVTLESVSFKKLKDVTNSALDYAEIAVDIALGLIGVMALWLGVMKIAEEAGLIKYIALALRPIMRFLFPNVPSDHPAIGSIIMNVSANFLGLGNAATPFGLKAMEELQKLNPKKETASNAMCTFLAINTAGLTMIPATAIAVRAAAGSSQPAVIIGTAIFGSFCATIMAILATKLFEKFPIPFREMPERIRANMKGILVALGVLALGAILWATGALRAVGDALSFLNPDLLKDVVQMASIVAIPLIIVVFVAFGAFKKVKVYETFVEGAKEGFNVAVRIIPYLVAMLMGIGIFRAGGAMEWLIMGLKPLTDLVGMPAEALPMALMRPLSGSGSLGVMAEIIATHGPDSFIGILVSTFFGSTETTFYVLAVYFGAVNIKNTRHALPAGLLADITGVLAALFIVRLLFG
ncbi:MAG: nucleoside recognition protein [Ignavibacteriales bacterium]|nr:nucleoside recognition protein [Ignavibacteriales bacterium]